MCTSKLKAALQVMSSHQSSALHLGSQSAACHQAFQLQKVLYNAESFAGAVAP